MPWIFGYGSLIWRPGFAFLEFSDAALVGWARRFWQGSPDHRGTPGSPGRVVTLVEKEGEVCWGRAYRVDEAARDEIVEQLDVRESGGYQLLTLPIERVDGPRVEGLVYVAGPGNPNFLGPTSQAELVQQVLDSEGDSGTNRDYVLKLSAALEAMGRSDPHVADLAAAVSLGRVRAGDAPT